MSKDQINKRLKELLGISDQEYEKLVAAYEKEVIKLSGESLRKIKIEIAKIYEKFGDNVQYSDLVSYNRLKNLETSIIQIVKDLTNEQIKNTKSKLSYFYSESFDLTSFAVEKSIEVNLAFGMLDESVIRSAHLNELSKIKWSDSLKEHAQKYVNDIRTELTRGFIEGKGYGAITKAITEKTGINANKVLRIVRTEGHRVQNAAKILSFENTEAAAERLGLKTNRVWLATLDNRTRDSHQTMDGQIADENNLFHYPGGETTEAPGISGPAEEVINCRCTFITQFSEFPQQLRKDNITKQFIPNQTYKQWKEGKDLV
jgi:hypothetical protein